MSVRFRNPMMRFPLILRRNLMRSPGPIPLGKASAQREMQELIKKADRDALVQTVHQDAEKEPLEAFPNQQNPKTGEIDGPKGPEPTRYGDWERKGRVYDF